MARGLGHVHVDRDAPLELRHRLVEAGAAGVREDRVAGVDEHPAHLSLARRQDLVGEAGHRQLPGELGQPADALAIAPPAGLAADPFEHRDGSTAPLGTSPRRAVEVAGDRVQRVDQPVRQRAGLLLADADPAVGDGAGRGGELAGEPGDRLRLDAGVPAARSAARPRPPPRAAPGRRSGRRAPRPTGLGEDRAQHPEQQVGVATGADRTCSDAWLTVSVRRGSTTTTLPPRSRIARRRSGRPARS